MTDSADELLTDHVQHDLAERSARGSLVALSASVTRFVAGTAATLVLARLLGPGDFGLIALALATTGLLARLKDAGLFTAAVQSRHITQAQATMLFWLSVALSALAAALILALAPVVAWFYRDTRLVAVTAALACLPLIDGAVLQLEAVMTRQMRFTALSVIDAGSLAGGIATALVLAWAGAGYWALVGQEIVYAAAYASAIWAMCRWRPGWPRRRSGVGPLVSFGLHLSGYRILNYLAMNLDTVFVGRFRGAQQAGLYDRAFRLLTIPATLLNQPLTSVAVPALSRLQDDGERYRTFYRAWVQLVFAVTMPIVVFLFVDTHRAVLTILGPQWVPLVPIYRVLAPAAFVGRLNVVNNWLYVTTGRTDRQLRWSAFVLVPMVIAYAIGVRWGALGVAAAHTVVTWALWYPGLAYSCRTSPAAPRDVLGAMAMPAATSVAAGIGLSAAMALTPAWLPAPAGLALDLAVYGALYGAAWLAFPTGRRSLAQLLGLAREALVRRRAPQA